MMMKMSTREKSLVLEVESTFHWSQIEESIVQAEIGIFLYSKLMHILLVTTQRQQF